MDEYNDTLNNPQAGEEYNERWKQHQMKIKLAEDNRKQREAAEKEQEFRRQENLENIRREQEKEEAFRQAQETATDEPKKSFLEQFKEKQEEKKNRKRILKKQKDLETMNRLGKEIGAEVVMSDAATKSLELEDMCENVTETKESINNIPEDPGNNEAQGESIPEKENIPEKPGKKPFRFREDAPEEEKKSAIPQGFIDFKNNYRKLYTNGMPAYGVSEMENAITRISKKSGISGNLLPACIIVFGYEFETMLLFFSIQSFQQLTDSLRGNDKFAFTCMYAIFADCRVTQHIYTSIYGDESRLRYISEKIIGPVTKYMDTKRGSISGKDFCNQILIPNIPELSGFKKIMCAD